MARTPGCDKSGLRKGTWTPEEDDKLRAYVTRYGCWNWRQLPKYAGLQRCGKSCRLRWLNYLRPNIKRGNYSKEEEETIIRLHEKLGNRWSAIAAELTDRTDNEVKNHWHTNLKKRFKDDKPLEAKADSTKEPVEVQNRRRSKEKEETNLNDPTSPPLILESSISCSSSKDNTVESSKDSVTDSVTCEADSGNFWTEPLFWDNFDINTGHGLDSYGYEFGEFPFLYGDMDVLDDGFYF